MVGFVVPPLDGPVTGGTLYNRELLRSLKALGVACAARSLEEAELMLATVKRRDLLWVDSLYLHALPRLAHARGGAGRVGLVAHYLPALVAHGDLVRRDQLSPAEREALAAASFFLVPSSTMAAVIARLGGGGRPVVCIEPGRLAPGVADLPRPPLRAVLVANLLPGKGVEDWLTSLSEHCQADDDFTLTIVGSPELDVAYAKRCLAFADHPRLRGKLRFLGAQPAAETLRLLVKGNLLVSASAMESYGMAVAEARTLGLPVFARRGGHVAALVGSASGGELFSDARALALGFLALARAPDEHCRRMQLAARAALPPRSWTAAARDFADAARALGSPSGRLSSWGGRAHAS